MQHVVIVGARATGVAVYIQLVSRLSEGSRITLIDPDELGYPGVFNDPASQLMTNTSAHIGSVVAQDPDDLMKYLPNSMDPHAVPRRMVGDYVRARFERFRVFAPGRGISTDRMRATVTEIGRTSTGYRVKTSTGHVIEATDVVLAMGSGPARLVPGVESVPPYPSTALLESAARLGRTKEPALVVGMGSSGIDAALVLASAGIRVHMVSRTGYFPAVRTRTLRLNALSIPARRTTLSLRRTLEVHTSARGKRAYFHSMSPAGHAAAQLESDLQMADPDDSPWQDGLADVVYLLGSRPMRLTDHPGFVWRHLTSVMRTTAAWLLDFLQQGLVTCGTLHDTDSRRYPLVVSGLGREPYPLFASQTGISLGLSRGRPHPITTLGAGLRVTLPGQTAPERIWAVGPTAGLSRVTSSSLCVAVAQAAEAAEQVASTVEPIVSSDV